MYMYLRYQKLVRFQKAFIKVGVMVGLVLLKGVTYWKSLGNTAKGEGTTLMEEACTRAVDLGLDCNEERPRASREEQERQELARDCSDDNRADLERVGEAEWVEDGAREQHQEPLAAEARTNGECTGIGRDPDSRRDRETDGRQDREPLEAGAEAGFQPHGNQSRPRQVTGPLLLVRLGRRIG